MPKSNETAVEDTSRVFLHAEIKALQLGAGAGLLIAVPGVIFAPATFNSTDAPPLVAAVSAAGVAAVANAGLVFPLTAYRLYRGGKAGVTERAELLRSNERVHQLNRVGLFGAAVGLALEGIRLRTIADMHNAPISAVATTQQAGWEAFCFAVVGSTIAVAVPTISAYIRENWSDNTSKTSDIKSSTDEEDKLVKSAETAEQGARSVAQGAEDAATDAVDGAEEAANDASKAADEATDKAADVADDAADNAESAYKEVEDSAANGSPTQANS